MVAISKPRLFRHLDRVEAAGAAFDRYLGRPGRAVAEFRRAVGYAVERRALA